jgi:glycosyltransferase involved in cell wall biosynthesis
MRVAVAYPACNVVDSIARELVLLVRALAPRVESITWFGDARLHDADVPAAFEDVEPGLHPLHSAAGWALFATRAARRLRSRRRDFDVVLAVATSSPVYDVVRVHAVTRAEQRRWPERGGRSYRLAGVRAVAAPVLHPQIAVDRFIQRLQFGLGEVGRAAVVTQEVAEDLVETFAVPAERIDVIPCAIDLERFEAARHRRLVADANGSGRLLFLGSDFERKGLAEALHALAGLPADTSLTVVGTGDQRPYAELASTLGVQERVTFAGGTDAPERFLEEADVLVLPTREDVWGMAIIEALAVGVPVVTTEAAGASDVVRQSDAGLVVPSGDAGALRGAVARLLEDSSRLGAMRRNGPPAAKAYAADAVAVQFLGTFERVAWERQRLNRSESN